MTDKLDLYAKALVLGDHKVMIVRYTITKSNLGKMQLSNSIKLLDSETKEQLKNVLSFIAPYVTDIIYAQ